MRFQTALEKLDGQSAGGQLIVHRNGVNVLVGRHHDGYLIVEDTDEARAVMAGLHHHDGDEKPRGRKKAEKDVEPTPEPTPEPQVQHEVHVSDEVVTADQTG